MAQDILKQIREAEEQAERYKADAKKGAEEELLKARREAQELIERAKEEAHAQGAKLIAEEAQEQQKRAQANFNTAVKLVLERVTES